MIGIFKHNTPLALLLLALLAMLPGITSNTLAIVAVPEGATVIYNELSVRLSFLDGTSGMLGKFMYAALLLAEALLLNKIISDHKLTEKVGFIPAMSFLLLNNLLPFQTKPVSLILIGIILLLMKLLIGMYKQNNANNQLLLTGICVGCLLLLNAQFLILYGWISICIMIMRAASAREWLLLTIGFVLPLYFLVTGAYLLDKLSPSLIFPRLSINFSLPRLSPLAWTKTCLFLALPWIGLIAFNRQIGKMMIQARKAYLIMLILLLSVLLISLFSMKDMSTMLMLMLVPATLLFSPLFLVFKKNLIPNLLCLALIVLALLR